MESSRSAIRVLVVDDEELERGAIELLLKQEGFDVTCAEDGAKALELAERERPALVVTDLRMPGMSGLELFSALRERVPGVPVIFVTGTTDVASAVTAMRAGAAHYLVKPIDFDELLVAIERAVARTASPPHEADADTTGRRAAVAGNGAVESGSFDGLLGTSPAMREVYKAATHVAPARATVLITGESGTGKGELARAIHAKSPRADKPFVALHCAALAETLLESELFGHEKGSFTGADKRRIGRFEQANGGTLFLDEIGEIPASTQLKLLRVLQERTIERVGGNDPIKIDVRLIAATNRDLHREVEERRFREDLYYRLNVVHIEMPPLRARGGDIVLLANHFLEQLAVENDKPIEGFTEAAVARLLAHRWPGNVRELENTIERAVVLADGNHIDADDLPLGAPPAGAAGGGIEVPGATLAEIERHAILTTLEAVGGSTVRAAEILGVSVRLIQYRLHEYGMARPRGRRPAGHHHEFRVA